MRILALKECSSAKCNELKKMNIRAHMYYVYILKSRLDNRLYTGYTSDLKNRLKEHNSGNVQSTKNRRPLELFYYEAYCNKQYALRREKYLKTSKGKNQLKKQIGQDMRV